MTLTDDLATLNTAVADPLDADVDLLDAFAPAQDLLGGSADYQRLRLRAATRFLEQHPDLGVWMTRPIEQRLVDVRGASSMWPLVTFALISTRVRADAEFLLTKGFGQQHAPVGERPLPERDTPAARGSHTDQHLGVPSERVHRRGSRLRGRVLWQTPSTLDRDRPR
jgi:hypothetical protein